MFAAVLPTMTDPHEMMYSKLNERYYMTWKGIKYHMVTKKEIADYLGISRTAVSFVLNNVQNNKISGETRERVLKAAKELGYRSNEAQKNICYLLCNREFNDSRYSLLMEDLEEIMSEQGYNLLFMSIKGPSGISKLESFLERNEADGVVVTGLLDDKIIHTLEQSGIPFVIYGVVENETGNIVTPDSELIAKEAIQYLIDKGHEKIALFTGRLDLLIHRQIFEGYKKAHVENGLVLDKLLVQVINQEDGYEMAKRMKLLDIEYTAAFCVENVIQFGILQGLKDAGTEVPGQISLLGYGYTELVKLSNPHLSTIYFDRSEITKLIISRLQHLISDRNAPPQKTVLDCIRIYPGETVNSIRSVD
ncbi:LacI family DNA-binding transcriptional regulator [Paenibacillus eucommiae]|uniref:DNA-binding LacI/PurR family transcriptional regulator n=1 Tax=Paenibacillus eucommiae TaxID=1355755 RepID=A0ABS4IXI5_9BACL|nr:LacI family DNA-binding transcriptional regulator [Paenibacillus eucommiae]MBP1992301.1 DNA-binding LacI/PurR family transcriptional regulator [Paenibacillus eucommiae]